LSFPVWKRAILLAEAQAFHGGGAPKSLYMRPRARRYDLFNWVSMWTLRGVNVHAQVERRGAAITFWGI